MKPLKLVNVSTITKPACLYSKCCARVFWIEINVGDDLNFVDFVWRHSGQRRKFYVKQWFRTKGRRHKRKSI
jgi:hypothetical protein